MSAALMGRATWHQGISLPEKMILCAIADVADDNGLAYLLVETLMMKSSASRRGVQNAIAGLIDKGILLRKERHNRSSIFKIIVESLPLGRPPVSEKEMTDDHFWGAGDAPRGAGGAPRGAGGARGGAGGAPILPVLTPVDTHVLNQEPPIPPKGDEDLFGEAVSESTMEDQIADRFVSAWQKLVEDNPAIPRFRMDDDRKRNLIRRIDERVSKGSALEVGFEVIDALIKRIDASDFHCGRTGDWNLDVDWVLKKANFKKMMERSDERIDRPRTEQRDTFAAAAEVGEHLRSSYDAEVERRRNGGSGYRRGSSGNNLRLEGPAGAGGA